MKVWETGSDVVVSFFFPKSITLLTLDLIHTDTVTRTEGGHKHTQIFTQQI